MVIRSACRPAAHQHRGARGTTTTTGNDMSHVDTLKTGGGQAVSFATVRLESRSLLPEQLTDLLIETAERNVDVDLHVESRGTGPSRN